MRWIRQRAQAVIQLRCIDVNGHWDDFISWTFTRLQARTDPRGACSIAVDITREASICPMCRLTEADLHPIRFLFAKAVPVA